ncbi:MAG TPA: hypothetical protein PK513_02980 [Alphaproteobacteria bacterium]|nr:hypothetical protein [Alphaproteobacteria bacterium]USO05775.1 MAG: hypothetical protein H6859_00795 [Rhodospirillales bacterium]HOO81450.1 hypothetical protein [Alphaproteobacteria bacterium]
MSATAAAQLYTPAPSLRDHWQRAGTVAERAKTALQNRIHKITDNPLTKTFAKAAMGAGAAYAVKTAAISLASTAGSGAVAAAVLGGAAVTTYKAAKDYRTQNKDRPHGFWANLKGFFSFLGQNKAKYAKQLAISSGLGIIGAAGLVETFAHAANAGEIDDLIMPENIANHYQPPEQGITTPPAEMPATEATEPQTAVTQTEPQKIAATPALTPLEKLSQINPDNFSGRAAETLSYAKKGHAWAVKEMAIHLLSGNNGSPLNREFAVELLQIAEHSDNPKIANQASRDLDTIKNLWPEAFAQEEITIAEAPEFEPTTSEVAEKPKAQALKEHIVTAEAPASPLERLAALNPENFGQRGQYVLQFAEKGHGWALNELASSLLYEGNGSPQDRKLAVELYRLAQETSNARIVEHATKDLAVVERLWGVDNIMGTSAPNEPKTLLAGGKPTPQELPMPKLPANTNIPVLCNAASTETGIDIKCVLDPSQIKSSDTFTINLPGNAEMNFYYDGKAANLGITEPGDAIASPNRTSNIVNLNLHFSHEAMQNPEAMYSITAGNNAYGISFSPQSEPPIQYAKAADGPKLGAL